MRRRPQRARPHGRAFSSFQPRDGRWASCEVTRRTRRELVECSGPGPPNFASCCLPGERCEGGRPMYTNEVRCSKPKCGKPAAYKIAAPWSYGQFSELKSYGLACSEHFG